jgi:uncharacterized protein YigE (DUF2233 family)
MKFVYLFLALIIFINSQSFTPLSSKRNTSDSLDSVYIHNIENELSVHRDYIYDFDQNEYDIVATEDSILNLKFAINIEDSNQKSIYADFLSESDSIYKYNIIDTAKLKLYKIGLLKKYHQVLKINENNIEIKKLKIESLKSNLDSFNKKKNKLTNVYDTIIQKIANNIYNVKSPLVFDLKYWNSNYKVVLINSNNNDLKIINNNTGSLKNIDFFYTKLINTKPIALMNAGMYERDGSPVGLLITDGKLIKNINLKKGLDGNFYKLKNAIFSIDSTGRYQINNTLAFNDFYKGNYIGFKYATQSGPVLITNGIINKELNIRSTNKLIRNGIGVLKNTKHNIAVLVISETPTTFYELASFFKILNCDNAMYLDGTVSSLYYIDSKNPLKNIKTETSNAGLGPIFSITERDSKKLKK